MKIPEHYTDMNFNTMVPITVERIQDLLSRNTKLIEDVQIEINDKFIPLLTKNTKLIEDVQIEIND